MRLSRLYTNRPALFVPITFTRGLNVVLAEIRRPENRRKDTHNLGKTTLGRIIDFCLLSGVDKKFFLIRHEELFRDFVFFLEIELLDRSFVTVRRAVAEPTKISFRQHKNRSEDLVDLPDESWDHAGVGFDKAKELLDGFLDLRDLKPWPYRKGVGYLLRSQEDFRDVFHLKKFAGAHADWKPFLARILGFDATTIDAYYKQERNLDEKKAQEQVIKSEIGGGVSEVSKVEGLLLLKQEEAEKRQRILDGFDFDEVDKDKTRHVADDIDGRISRLNLERYTLSANRKKIQDALKDDEILFDPKRAAELFAEAGVVFAGQIRRDFEQLINFNRAITDERRAYLKEELAELDRELRRVGDELRELGQQRREELAFVTTNDIFAKYRLATDELVTLRADITSLERQRTSLRRLQDLRAEIRSASEELGHLQTRIEQDVEQRNSEKTSLFSKIRLYFSEIVEAVINRKALLSVAPNQHGHLEFRVEILDESGNPTSADHGNTYRKLLCVAFDLALARAHIDGRYPRFVFHDGVFEALDDRKKRNLDEVIRRYTEMGVQHIVTLIDSDLPAVEEGEAPMFDDAEIVLTLHDEDENGRLFRMKAW
ncbi:MAG: DUF2326 domain-containing protein [Myxococcales bacterium]|nr:DUF2326 domain-containing protein [Myxococcales bacterium]